MVRDFTEQDPLRKTLIRTTLRRTKIKSAKEKRDNISNYHTLL